MPETKMKPCPGCNGAKTCTSCGGTGFVDRIVTMVCAICSGDGICSVCRGTGETENLESDDRFNRNSARATAERHIRDADALIARQRRLIARIAKHRLNTKNARDILTMLLEARESLRRHRDLISARR